MEEKRLIMILLLAGLIVFLIIGTGTTILNYFSVAEFSKVRPQGIGIGQWPTAEFVDRIRGLMLISFIIMLIGLVAALLFVFVDILLKPKTEKFKSCTQLLCGLIMLGTVIGLIVLFNQMTSEIPPNFNYLGDIYLYYPYSFAIEAQGQLFLPIICLVAISFITIPTSIMRFVAIKKNRYDVDTHE